jgi:hypothetical protein
MKRIPLTDNYDILVGENWIEVELVQMALAGHILGHLHLYWYAYNDYWFRVGDGPDSVTLIVGKSKEERLLIGTRYSSGKINICSTKQTGPLGNYIILETIAPNDRARSLITVGGL